MSGEKREDTGTPWGSSGVVVREPHPRGYTPVAPTRVVPPPAEATRATVPVKRGRPDRLPADPS